MSTLESYVPLIQAEAERLAQFVDTLSTDDLQRPSACELWQIHDVVAHLEPANDTMAGVTLRCDEETFALLMYKRLTLGPATAQGRAVVDGDQKLITALDEWLKQT